MFFSTFVDFKYQSTRSMFLNYKLQKKVHLLIVAKARFKLPGNGECAYGKKATYSENQLA